MAFGFEDAEKCGGVVEVDKRQSSVIQQINDDLTAANQEPDPNVKHGLCMGYSATWITKSAKGEDFWTYVDSATARADLKQMARREGNFRAIAKEGMFEKMPEDLKKKVIADQERWADKFITSSGGLEKTGDRYQRKGFDGGAMVDLCDRLTEGEGYKLLCMQGTLKGSHTVAVSVSAGEVTYMDPNAGQVKFPDRDQFSFWFATRYVPHYEDAKFQEYYIDSYKAPINAAQTAQKWQKPTKSLPTGTRRPFAMSDRTHDGGQSPTSSPRI